jgi:hypothetical protein
MTQRQKRHLQKLLRENHLTIADAKRDERTRPRAAWKISKK